MSRVSAFLDSGPGFLCQAVVLAGGYSYARKRFDWRYWNELRNLEGEDRQPVEHTQAWQLARVQALVRTAYERSDYYRRSMDEAGFHPRQLMSLADIVRIPLLEKQAVRTQLPALCVADYSGRVERHRSSGTTGQPTEFVVSSVARWSLNFAHLYHLYGWHGFRLGDRRATLGGRYLGKRPHGAVYYNPFERQLLLGVHSLSEQSIKAYARALRRFRPKIIQGHPSAISQLVELSEGAGLRLPPLEGVFVTGENAHPDQIARIETGFGCQVTSFYGMGELAAMAAECEHHEGFHVDEHFSYVELIPHPSGFQEIVTTAFINDAMPLIRYRTGDLTDGWAKDDCRCGRSWRRLGRIIGRIDEVITDTKGRTVLPVQVRTALSQKVRGIPSFTLVQKQENLQYDILLFTDVHPQPSLLASTLAVLHSLLGGDASINVVVRPSAEGCTAGGKHRTVRRE